MQILVNGCSFNTKKDAIFLYFEDDNDLNEFLSNIAKTPVKTSGIRLISLITEDMGLNPVQKSIVEIISGFDGAFCDNVEQHLKILDNSINKIQDLIDGKNG